MRRLVLLVQRFGETHSHREIHAGSLKLLRQGWKAADRRDHLLDALVDIRIAGTLPDGDAGDRPVVEH